MQKGMDAVVSKSARRTPMLKRKGGAPAMTIVVESGPPAKPDASDAEAPETLTCPKCGMSLEDTPENRAYVEAKDADDDNDDDY
jgi:hypothetical protein